MAPFVNLVEAEELLESVLSPPTVYQLGDEVDAWLDGEHKSGLQRSCQAQRLIPEHGALGFAVVTHPHFAQVLHIVHVEAHHVPHAAWEEQRVSTSPHRLVHVALHQPQRPHALGDGGTRLHVYVAEGNSRRYSVHSCAVRLQAQVEDDALLLAEIVAHGACRRQVAAVVAAHLGARVEQKHVALVRRVYVPVIVQRLPVRRRYHREGVVAPSLLRNGRDCRAHFRLVHPRAHHTHHRTVHVHADVHRPVDLGHLLVALVDALVHDGAHHRRAGSGVLRPGREPQPGLQLHAVLAPIGRQEVHRAPFAQRLAQHVAHFVGGQSLAHAHTLRLAGKGGLCSHPHDVIDGRVVAEHYLPPLVDVDDGRQPLVVDAEEVEKRGVLPERVGVVLIVHGRLIVAQEEQHPAPNGFL